MTSKEYEREIDELSERLANGEIELREYNKELKAIERWYRDAQLNAAEHAAREAYAREMERW